MSTIPCETIISYFDIQLGPSCLMSGASRVQQTNSMEYDEITKLMDIHDPGDFFTHIFNGKITINYVFSIEDRFTRGGEHLLMSTMMFKNNEINLGTLVKKMPVLEQRIKIMSESIAKNLNIKEILDSKRLNTRSRKECYSDVQSELFNVLRRK